MAVLLRFVFASLALALLAAPARAQDASVLTTNADLGAPSDAAWSGTGAGAVSPVLKYIAAKDEAIRALLAGTLAASGKTPVTTAFTATGQSASFTPIVGRAFNVSVWGTFVATVQVERSFDSGTTWLPLTAAGTQLYLWTARASETAEEAEVGVIYRLNCTSYTSGTVNTRISQ